jgi:hypothetical protein
MAKDVHAVQSEDAAHDGDFLEVETYRVDRRVCRDVGVAAAQLVVEDDLASGGCHRLQRLEGVPGESRATVQAEQWQLPWLSRSAHHPAPDPVAAEGNVAILT